MIKVLLISVFSFIAFSDGSYLSKQTPEEIAQNWTDKTRSYILKSYVNQSKANESEFIKTTIGGIGIDLDEPLESDELTTSEMAAKDPDFVYIKKRRSNGMLCFDAIAVKGALYGTAEWFRTNGNYEKIGYYYNNTPCGKWKYYSSSNEIDSIVNYGNDSLLLNLEKKAFLRKHSH